MSPRPELHRGRLAKHPKVLGVRALTRDDLGRLQERRVGAPRMKAFRETHHRLARLVAMGLRDSEICRITAYSHSRLSALKQDPAFAELVTQYRGKVDEAYERQADQFYAGAVELKLRGLEQIAEHFDRSEDEGELLPLRTLLPLVADLADRTGHGKHSTQTTQVQDFAKMMEQLALSRGRSNVIDAPRAASSLEGEPATPADLPLPESSSATVGFRRR